MGTCRYCGTALAAESLVIHEVRCSRLPRDNPLGNPFTQVTSPSAHSSRGDRSTPARSKVPSTYPSRIEVVPRRRHDVLPQGPNIPSLRTVPHRVVPARVVRGTAKPTEILPPPYVNPQLNSSAVPHTNDYPRASRLRVVPSESYAQNSQRPGPATSRTNPTLRHSAEVPRTARSVRPAASPGTRSTTATPRSVTATPRSIAESSRPRNTSRPARGNTSTAETIPCLLCGNRMTSSELQDHLVAHAMVGEHAFPLFQEMQPMLDGMQSQISHFFESLALSPPQPNTSRTRHNTAIPRVISPPNASNAPQRIFEGADPMFLWLQTLEDEFYQALAGPPPQMGLSKDLVEQLPTEVASKKSGQCMICLEDYVEGEQMRWLPCFHRYHVKCIDEWFARSIKCPVCKQDVAGN